MLREHEKQLKRMTENGDSDGNSDESDSGSESSGDENEEWEGFAEPPAVDYEAEYVDEDKYTTVTVEEMDLSRDALYRQKREDDGSDPSSEGGAKQKEQSQKAGTNSRGSSGIKKSTRNTDKPKKKKRFRYESKEERKLSQAKQRLSKKRKADARRER